jgi:hypothetical protein
LSATAFANNWLLYLPAILQNDQGGTDPDPDPPVILGEMNDTGIVTGVGVEGVCTAGEDCKYGRDVTDNSSSDGHAGFSFNTITSGDDTCVQDNVTGLVWSLDKGGGVTWGEEVDGLITTANTDQLCGKTGWRLPTVNELIGIVDYHEPSGPTIEATFFNDITSTFYWTSTDVEPDKEKKWVVNFSTGGTDTVSKADVDGKSVLLVFDNTTDT